MPQPDDLRIRDAASSGVYGVGRNGEGERRLPATAADASHGLMEEVLDHEVERVLPLKNGRQIEARLGLATYQSLGYLFQRDPGLFLALRDIAEGRPEKVAPRQTSALREALFLRRDLSIDDSVRDVLLSAYQEAPDGPVLVNPFKLQNPDEARALEQMQKAGFDRAIRLLRSDDEGKFRG